MIDRDSECYRFGPFLLDVNERELRRGSTLVPLPGKAFDLLLTLVRGSGRTVTKSELTAALWPDTTVEDSNLTQTVFVLRKALGEDTEETGYIQTVPRRGYKFALPVAAEQVENGRSALVRRPQDFWSRPRLTTALALMLLAAAATGLGFHFYGPERPVPLDLSTYRYRPFASAHGNETRGVWSPDGKTIAFKEGGIYPEDLPARLMLQPSDGGAATLLVDQIDGWTDLAWSPDSSRVYFKKEGSIYSVSPAGGTPEFIMKASIAASFGVTPDGKSLVIWRGVTAANGSERSSVWISSPPGAEPHEYIPAPFAMQGNLAVSLRISPNGKLIYLSIVTGRGGETWLIPFPPGSGSPRRIFRNARPFRGGATWASWMPDSRRLIFSAGGLWLGDIQKESIVKLTDGAVLEDFPAVSPDGRRVLFSRVETDADIVELRLDGSPPRKLLATDTFEVGPGWSPRGGEFAYVTTRNGNHEIWLHSWPGDFERPIVTAREFPRSPNLYAPVFSPDGARIAYVIIGIDGERQRNGGLYISPRTGGKPTRLIEGASRPSWSPDGTSLAFVRTPTGGLIGDLVTLRVGPNQQPFVIPKVICVPALAVWSPSGEWIACETAAGPVLVSPDGKQRRTLPRLNSRVLGWSQDSRTLYGLREQSGSWSLLAEDVSSGAIRKVADYGPDFFPFAELNYWVLGLSLSPDGKSFAVGTWKTRSNLWMLEGFAKNQ